jgi:HlyD family secretion protein
VAEGDSVRAGQLLVQLDDAELRAAVAQAAASLLQAEAALDAVTRVRSAVTAATRRQAESAYRKAQADLARVTRLHESGGVSDDELERARERMLAAKSEFEIADAQAASMMAAGADRKSAEAAVAAARASRDAARARLANASITAPAAGVILTRSVEPGDLVQPGRVLMEMGIRSTAQLVVVPDERNLATLAIGQRAMASADAFPGERFPARVSYVSPSVDATQGTVEVRLQVDSVPAYLRSDMTVSVEIEVARKPRALVIPLDAVREPMSPSPWVLVHRNGRAERQVIRIGARGEQLIEVLDGVKSGEVVVQPGLRKLEPGSRVRVRTNGEP